MGLFLGLSGVIGKSDEEVIVSLRKYVSRTGGGLVAETVDVDYPNCCIIETASGNTTVIYPGSYFEWEQPSAFISLDLKAPVFSFHIHDGDLWMYILYVDGQVVDQFNPIPDYWNDNISVAERESWKGNAEILAKYVTGLNTHDIDNYLVTWQLEEEEIPKAYPSDKYPQEDWQLIDFMEKLNLPYPLDDDVKSTGHTYRLWDKPVNVQWPGENNASAKIVAGATTTQKPWWKFW